MAAPKKKISECSQERSAIVESFKKDFIVDQTACRRLEIKLEALFKVPDQEAEARIEYALVQSMRKKSQAANLHLARAEQILGKDNSRLVISRLSSAINCGEFSTAVSYLESAAQLADVSDLPYVMTSALHLGMISKANEILNRLNLFHKASPGGFGLETEVDDDDLINDVRLGGALISASPLTEEDIHKRVCTAAKVISNRYPALPFLFFEYHATTEGIAYGFPLRRPVPELCEVDWEISEALVDEFPDVHSDLISFYTRPVTDEVSYYTPGK